MNILRPLAGVLLAASCSTASYAKMKTVTVTPPGTLSVSVNQAELSGYDGLAINGVINNSDIIFLRELCGRDSLDRETTQYVKDLDLSGAMFENSGPGYFLNLGKSGQYSVYDSSTLPSCIFYNIPLESLTFPIDMDSIAPYALVGTRLKSLIIPDGVGVADKAIANDSLLKSLRLPAMKNGISPSNYSLRNIRHIEFGDIGYLPSGSFRNMPEIEEIIFNGMVGHIDGYQIENCPKLKRVIFRGPVASTGGLQFASGCPELEEIRFDGLVLGLGLVDNPECPKLGKYVINGALVDSADSLNMPVTPIPDIITRKDLTGQIAKLAEWQIKTMSMKGWDKRIALYSSDFTARLAEAAGMTDLYGLITEAQEANKDPDIGKTKLQILKESAPYKANMSDTTRLFSYAQATDSLLTLSREYFNLDSVAGNGDDISRIKNLLYWVHDLVRHDGGSTWPSCRFNLRDLKKVCQEQERGLNCRFMAMMLTEALLSEGIPSRYITCQPKAYDEDSDCHVICIAWSSSLGKWGWIDPTFCAYVTDENGVMLHPGEVRYRLRNDLPLELNSDANWNHESVISKEHYLENYMAKNLYLISANTIQQPEPEGESDHVQGKEIVLAPEGFDYSGYGSTITDDNLFWQPPTR